MATLLQAQWDGPAASLCWHLPYWWLLWAWLYANNSPGWSHAPLIHMMAHPLKSRWRQSHPHGSARHGPFHSSLQGPQPQGMEGASLVHLNRTGGPTLWNLCPPLPCSLLSGPMIRMAGLMVSGHLFILLLSGRIASSFHWVGWPILISLLNHHLAILIVFPFLQYKWTENFSNLQVPILFYVMSPLLNHFSPLVFYYKQSGGAKPHPSTLSLENASAKYPVSLLAKCHIPQNTRTVT